MAAVQPGRVVASAAVAARAEHDPVRFGWLADGVARHVAGD
jgi:hypothetical protein